MPSISAPLRHRECKSLSVPHEQDDNALFYQIMCVLHGDAFTGRPGGQLVTDLSDIIFYMDFSGIFDRSGARKKHHLIRQEKARALFRPRRVSPSLPPRPSPIPRPSLRPARRPLIPGPAVLLPRRPDAAVRRPPTACLTPRLSPSACTPLLHCPPPAHRH